MNSVGDDFFSDEFILDALNTAQDFVVSTLVTIEKVGATTGSRKKLRALDKLRRTQEITPASYTAYNSYYRSFSTLPSLKQLAQLSYKNGDNYAVMRELHDNERNSLEHGNAIPSTREVFYYIDQNYTAGTYGVLTVGFSGSADGTDLVLTYGFYSDNQTLVVTTTNGESRFSVIDRAVYEINKTTTLPFSAQVSGSNIILTAKRYDDLYVSNASFSGGSFTISPTLTTTGVADTYSDRLVVYSATNTNTDRVILSYIANPRKVIFNDYDFPDLPIELENATLNKTVAICLLKEDMGEKQIKASEQFEALFQREFQGAIQ